MNHLRANLLLVALTLLIGCVAYPLAPLGIGQLVFPTQANGSLIEANGKAVGSRLIAQNFTATHYFHPRPSAVDYNGAASGGSNWSANNPKLRARVVGQLNALARPSDGPPVPADLVTTSGSGLDPHITLRSAHYQLDRVAAARASSDAERPRVRQQIDSIIRQEAFIPLGGLTGEPLVNVLDVNLRLDRELPVRSSR